jgi:hypothetical protein
MLASAGVSHPSDLGPHHLVRRVSQTEIKLFSQLHPFLKPRELLEPNSPNEFYDMSWAMARVDSFDAVKADAKSAR